MAKVENREAAMKTQQEDLERKFKKMSERKAEIEKILNKKKKKN